VSRLAVAESSGDPPKRYERAAGQAAGPVSNRTIHRSAASELSGSTPGPSQSIHTPKRRERAVGEYAGPVSTEPPAEAPRASRRAVCQAHLDRTIRRSDTSEPPGKPPGPSRTEPSAEALPASRRASRWARLDPSAEAMYASCVARRRTCANPPPLRPAARARHRVREPAGGSTIEPNPLDYSL